MELRKSTDRRSKSESNYERFNNFEGHVEVEDNLTFNYHLPAQKSRKKNGLMLELDTRNANWLIAASQKKYIPVGQANNLTDALNTLQQIHTYKAAGYVVVAEDNALPFQQNLFDLVWKFSPYDLNCVTDIHVFAEKTAFIMAKSGILKIALQNATSPDISRGCRQLFSKRLSSVHQTVRSFMGTLAMKMAEEKNASTIVQIASNALAFLSTYFPIVNRFSDSVFLNAHKVEGSPNFRIQPFLKHHWLRENLNIAYLLQCPISGGAVYLSKDSKFVISELANVKYPVLHEIPIMLVKAAIQLDGNKSAAEPFKLIQG